MSTASSAQDKRPRRQKFDDKSKLANSCRQAAYEVKEYCRQHGDGSIPTEVVGGDNRLFYAIKRQTNNYLADRLVGIKGWMDLLPELFWHIFDLAQNQTHKCRKETLRGLEIMAWKHMTGSCPTTKKRIRL